MRTLTICAVAIGVAIVGLYAQEKEYVPSCNMCPGTYIPKSEIDAYVKRGYANQLTDQQVRQVSLGKANVGVAVVTRGKINNPAAVVAEHDLVSERLGQLDFLRPIRRTIDMANANKASDSSTHQKRHCEKSLCAVSFQMLTPIAVNARISLDVIANHRTCCEKQFLNYCVLFPE